MATLTAADTTMATFYSLMLTSFKGFTEFGFIAGTGVMMCFAVAYLVLPALIVAAERAKPLKLSPAPGPAPRVATVVRRRRRRMAMAVSVVILAVYGAYTVYSLSVFPPEFEYDFRNLKSIDPEGDAVNAKKSGSTEGLTLSPTVAVARDDAQARRLWEDLKSKARDQENFDRIMRVVGDTTPMISARWTTCTRPRT
jgi:predicted RND superfamily exporter protein